MSCYFSENQIFLTYVIFLASLLGHLQSVPVRLLSSLVDVEDVWIYEWLDFPIDILIGLPGMIGIVSVPVAASYGAWIP